MGEKPYSFVVSFNVSKKHNVGTIARCCTAFNVKALCLVGSREYNSFGSHGSDLHVNMLHFASLDECCNKLRTEHGCRIIGVLFFSSHRLDQVLLHPPPLCETGFRGDDFCPPHPRQQQSISMITRTLLCGNCACFTVAAPPQIARKKTMCTSCVLPYENSGKSQRKCAIQCCYDIVRLVIRTAHHVLLLLRTQEHEQM
jgi:hypothetical protein